MEVFQDYLTLCVQHRRTIPPEITDLIIACVGLEDHDRLRRRTLLACTLVCSTWLPASRRQLFRRVEFGPLAGDVSLEHFLQMNLHSQFMRHHLSYISEIYFDTSLWVADDQCYIHRLVGHIPSLETLIFEDFDWNDPPWHPSTFTIFSGFPALHTLVLLDCTFPSFSTLRHMLSAVSRLAALSLYQVNWPPPKRLNLPSTTRRRPALASLEVNLHHDREAEILQWLCTTPTIRSIKCIHVGHVPNGEDGHDKFLRMSAPSVRELRCRAGGTTRQSHPSDFEWLKYRNMTHFPCLTDIKMLAQHILHMISLEKLIADVESEKFWTFYRDLSHTLQHFSGHHFHEIQLWCIDGYRLNWWTQELSGLGGGIASHVKNKGHPGSGFKPLEQILTRENMEDMAIVFPLYSTHREQGDRFRLALQSKLPELYKHCVFEYEEWE